MAGIDFRLYLITDRRSLPQGRCLEDAVRAALDGGVGAVQLREKDLAAAQLLPLAETLRRLTTDYGARLLINDRIDLALAVEADGVHLGRHSLPTALARQLLGPDRLVGVSTHAPAEIAAAAADGASFVTFGPVWATPSKAAYGAPVGLKALRGACVSPPLPVFALGGITSVTAVDALTAGAHGLALIAAVQNAPDPAAAARLLRCLDPR